MTSNISGLTGGTPAVAIANASGTPQDVIVLAPNIPLVWDSESGLAAPFLGSVSSVYVTNVNACRLQMRPLTY
jgi:hypothetical protein